MLSPVHQLEIALLFVVLLLVMATGAVFHQRKKLLARRRDLESLRGTISALRESLQDRDRMLAVRQSRIDTLGESLLALHGEFEKTRGLLVSEQEIHRALTTSMSERNGYLNAELDGLRRKKNIAAVAGGRR